MREMRRKDREVTDEARIDEIISRCNCCRIGFNDSGEVYIVPLNYGYVKQDGRRTFYFHSAKDGRKIDLVKEDYEVGFEMDCGYELHPGESPCDCYAEFSSIIGNGNVSIVADPDEKILGLQSLMKHTAGKENCEFRPEMLDAVCVFRLDVDRLTCKVHL